MTVLKRDVSNRRAIARNSSHTAKSLESWLSDLSRLDELETTDSPQFAAINLGHASDTTLSRASAGVLAVEGVNVLTATAIGSTVQAYDADLTTLGALGAGARSALGLAIGTDVQAYDADLTTLGAGGSGARDFLGLGTANSPQFTALEIGHATDTTLTRASAGVLAVEGSNLLRAADLGSSVQAYDADLTTIAGLTQGYGHVIVSNNSGWLSEPLDTYTPVINGDFNIWQRGTSFTSVADSTFLSDRFMYGKTGAMVHDISRSTDVPSVASAGRLFNYSMLVDCTTVDSSIASTDYAVIQQRIEGFMFLPLAQRTFTVSFWVKGTKTGIHCFSVRNAGSDRSYVAEYTINTTATWEFKTVTVTASPSAGTWDYTTGIGLTLTWALACGSTYQTTANAWQSGIYFATSNQVNACDSTSNDFRITGVRVVAGSAAKPLIVRPFPQELAMCERYFEAIISPSDIVIAQRALSALIIAFIRYRTVKRTSPSLAAGTGGNPSWATAFPSGNQLAWYEPASTAYAVNTGAVSYSFANGNTIGTEFRITAATSFDQTSGEVGYLYAGNSVGLFASAEM